MTLAGGLPTSPECPIALAGGLPTSPECSIALAGGLPASPECPIVPAGGLPTSPECRTTLAGRLPASFLIERPLPRRTNPQGKAQPLRLLAAHQRTHLLGNLLLAHLGI